MKEKFQSCCTRSANVARASWLSMDFVTANSFSMGDLRQYRLWVKTRNFYDASADRVNEVARDVRASACAFC